MDDFTNLTDDQIQQLIQLGVIPDEQTDLQKQMDQADALRYASAPEGRYVRGGLYVAASPLEHIARAAQGIKAGRDLDRLRDQQQSLLQQQVSGRQAFLDALRGRTRVGKGAHSFTVGEPPMQDFTLDPNLVQMPRF